MERHEAVPNLQDIASGIQKSKCTYGTPYPIEKKLPESDRGRRSAVDQEILRYLGALAKKDPEGFAYPSTRRVAEKIQRTQFYVGQRIRHLEKIGRLIPTQRERFGRPVNGWIVVRYDTWAASQALCTDSSKKNGRPPQPSENSLRDHPKNLADDANSLEGNEHSDHAKPLQIKADAAIDGAGRSGLDLSYVHESDGLSPSQFTGPATATDIDRHSKSSSKTDQRKTKKTLRDRLVEKISRRGDHLSIYRVNEGVEAYEDFLETIRAASEFLAFPFDENDPAVSFGFCTTLCEIFERFKPRLQTEEMKASTFCTKVIDACDRDKNELWPPSFTEHRNRLRQAEKTDQIRFWVKKDSDGADRITKVDKESLDWN